MSSSKATIASVTAKARAAPRPASEKALQKQEFEGDESDGDDGEGIDMGMDLCIVGKKVDIRDLGDDAPPPQPAKAAGAVSSAKPVCINVLPTDDELKKQ